MQKSIQRPIYEEINSRLYTWYLEQKARGQLVTDMLFLTKAVEICKSLGRSATFTASENWLWDFKKHYNIDDVQDQTATDLSMKVKPGTSTNVTAGAMTPAAPMKINEIPISILRVPVIARTRAPTSTSASTDAPAGTSASMDEPVGTSASLDAPAGTSAMTFASTDDATQYLKLYINRHTCIKVPKFVKPPRYVNMSTYAGSVMYTNPNAAGSNIESNATTSSATVNASVPEFLGVPAVNVTENVPSYSQAKAIVVGDTIPIEAAPQRVRYMETKTTDSEAQLFLKDFTRRLKEEKISSRNIYYAKNTGFAWKLIPRNLLVPCTRDIEQMFEKERVTIGLCVNASGSHKLAPLLIHKCKRPKALKHCKDQLPVILASQTQAQMDHDVFTEWYNKHFKPTVNILQFPQKGGKVFLLLDNYQKHRLQLVKEESNDNFEIIFLPECATSLMLSIEEKMMGRVKKIYRLKMLRQMLNFPEGARKFYYDFDLKDCIDLLSAAWTEITVANIQNVWSSIIEKTWESLLIKEEPVVDPLESTLQDIVSLITGNGQSEETVNEFLLRCQDIERHFLMDEMKKAGDKDVEEKNDNESADEDEVVSHENIKWAFETLVVWSKQHPQYIQQQVEYLKNYYEKSIEGN